MEAAAIKQAIKQGTTHKPRMNLKGGVLSLMDKYPGRSYKPAGSDGTLRMPDGQIIFQTCPTVQFHRHLTRIEDADIARAMVGNMPYQFEEPWGFHILAECVPEPVAKFWPRLSKESRQQVTLLLIDGEDTESVAKVAEGIAMPPEVLAARDTPGPMAETVVCPVCGLTAGVGKNAREARRVHVEAMHPEYPINQLDN
jgi:hypothetical protein